MDCFRSKNENNQNISNIKNSESKHENISLEIKFDSDEENQIENNVVTKNNYSLNDFPSLPLDGWIKPCFFCYIQTSRFIIINNDKYYMCYHCIKNEKYNILKKKYNLISTFLIDK